MATATDDDFESSLVDDLGWRRIELTSLRKSLLDAAAISSDGPASRALSRAMIAMSYAHWEGYAKSALEHYGKLVARRKPKVSEASDGLVLEHARRLVKRIAAGDADASRSLIQAVRGESDERLKIERALMSDTKANLRYNTLVELFTRACLPLSKFELKANLIDVLLCDRRNTVAHGRALVVAPAESAQICDDVLMLMEAVQDVLVVQVRTKGYLVESS